MDIPHTITELAKKRLHEMKEGLIKPEDQPGAAAILEHYIKHLMADRVYKSKRENPRLAALLGSQTKTDQ